jgi:Ca2+-binding EF-hand superfamily protein
MNKHLLGGALACAMTAMTPAAAQAPAPAPVAPQANPQGWQARGWGSTHTRAEVAAHVRTMFERLDGNRDGYVTKAEAEAAKGGRGDRFTRRFERRGGARDFGGRPADRGALFDRMDANHDGYVSRDEFARAPMREERRIVFRDGRGSDSRAAAPGGGGMRGMRMGMGMGGLRGRMFEMADANRDGRVTLQEATNAALRHFDTADVNRDGRLTPEERMQMHQRMRAERRRG